MIPLSDALAFSIPRGLPRRQVNFLLALTRHSSLTIGEYQVLAGVSRVTAQHDLGDLLGAGLIVRCGRARASRYMLQQSPPAA